MKNLTLLLISCLVFVSLSARFQLNSRFMTTNLWTYIVDVNIRQDVIFDLNGKVYNSDNKTQFQDATWTFDEQKQKVEISRLSGTCRMNTVFISQNPTFYPDVTIIGI